MISPSAPGPAGDEVRDLQLVLLASGISAAVLALIALAAERTDVLPLPTPETFWLAALAGTVALLGWGSLRARWPARPTAWAVLLTYTVVVTLAVHYTGGPQTPMPALYLLVIVAAAFVLGPIGVTVITIASLVDYAVLLILAFRGSVSVVEIWGTPFEAPSKGMLLLVNWLAVATPALLTAFMCSTLAQRLRTHNQELRQSQHMRQMLVELMVHDLRNPLTVLLSVLELIQIVSGKSLSDDQRRLIDNARRSGHVMVALIGDILDISRLEAGQLKLKLQRLDIPALLRDTAEQVKIAAEQHELTVEVVANGRVPPVTADPQLIQRVLANLVSNAMAHTPPGGVVTLAASGETPGFVTVSVRDTGQGIPIDQQKRIFEKFIQVEQGAAQRRGTGLGLTFCKLAVDAHRGKIWVESTPGQGSAFIFSLPVPIVIDGPAQPAQLPESVQSP